MQRTVRARAGLLVLSGVFLSESPGGITTKPIYSISQVSIATWLLYLMSAYCLFELNQAGFLLFYV